MRFWDTRKSSAVEVVDCFRSGVLRVELKGNQIFCLASDGYLAELDLRAHKIVSHDFAERASDFSSSAEAQNLLFASAAGRLFLYSPLRRTVLSSFRLPQASTLGAFLCDFTGFDSSPLCTDSGSKLFKFSPLKEEGVCLVSLQHKITALKSGPRGLLALGDAVGSVSVLEPQTSLL